jgi:hypothetical protein
MTNIQTSGNQKDYQKHEDLPLGMCDELIDDGCVGFITKAVDRADLATEKQAFANYVAEILDATAPQNIFQKEALKIDAERDQIKVMCARHKILHPENDQSVIKLLELEERYKKAHNQKELALVMAIEIHEDGVKFTKIPGKNKLKRVHESGSIDSIDKKKSLFNRIFNRNIKGIFNHNGNTFFTWDAARKMFGNKIPSHDKWKAILNAIPGQSDGTHSENIAKILSIPYVGACDSNGSPHGD